MKSIIIKIVFLFLVILFLFSNKNRYCYKDADITAPDMANKLGVPQLYKCP